MVAGTPKNVPDPLFTVFVPQPVIVLVVVAEDPPISFPGLMELPAERNKTGLFTLLIALPYTLLDPPLVLVISALLPTAVALCLRLLYIPNELG